MRPKTLLTFDNAKTIKGEKMGVKTYILYMSSGRQNAKEINLCSHASEGCLKACLFKSGFGGFYSTVETARINKANYYIEDRQNFLNQLVTEITKLKKSADKTDFKLAIRLNGTTDIAWEKHKISDNKNIFELFENVDFYDYTKNHKRFEKELPKNYHLTFSRSETNNEKCIELLNKGNNVAMVFERNLPKTYLGFEVINGDESDYRIADPKGVIVGLKYKKLTYKNADNSPELFNGFVIKENELIY